MHFFMSLFFLAMTIGLIYLYLMLPLGALILCRAAWLRSRYYKLPENERGAETPPFLWKSDGKIALLALVLTVAFTVFAYIDQRDVWMGEDNAHLEAKEYFVAGQVVYGVRTAFCKFLRVDSVITLPFFTLHEAIYKRGIQYLPEDDGERGVWTDLWFVYLYSKKMEAPKGTSKVRYSPKMVALLDTSWSAIEQEASYPFADRQMEKQHYYRNFPGQAFYYNNRKGYYAGKKYGSSKFYTRDPELMARTRKLIKWLEELEDKWQTSKETQVFLEKNPKVEAIRQMVLLMEISDVIVNEIMNKKFTCENDSVQHYLQLRMEFAGDDTFRPAYKRMKDRAQARNIYDVAVNSRIAMFQKYILTKYCGEDVPGVEDMSKFTGWGEAPEKFLEGSLKNLFSEELKMLEEWNNGSVGWGRARLIT
jgi:hypothetical protein